MPHSGLAATLQQYPIEDVYSPLRFSTSSHERPGLRVQTNIKPNPHQAVAVSPKVPRKRYRPVRSRLKVCLLPLGRPMRSVDIGVCYQKRSRVWKTAKWLIDHLEIVIKGGPEMPPLEMGPSHGRSRLPGPDDEKRSPLLSHNKCVMRHRPQIQWHAAHKLNRGQ